MRALTPDTASISWAVTNQSDQDDDVTLEVENGSGGGHSALRTMRRLGTVIGPHGSVLGQDTDSVAVAGLAIASLLLEAIPPGLGQHETKVRVDDLHSDARALAVERSAWSLVPLSLAGVDYALWTRSLQGGLVAHADLGWATVAMWSASALYAGPFRLTDVSR